jgi:hypothetical protein
MFPVLDRHRVGEVKGRSQVFDPKTAQWVKRGTYNGLHGREAGRR